jgi:cell wall-associated NlpC family hydrolase
MALFDNVLDRVTGIIGSVIQPPAQSFGSMGATRFTLPSLYGTERPRLELPSFGRPGFTLPGGPRARFELPSFGALGSALQGVLPQLPRISLQLPIWERPKPSDSEPSASPAGDIDQFLQQHVAFAQQALREAGLPETLAPIMAAIAANETGYGRAVAGNNFFGIKATGNEPQTGPLGTWEVVNGQAVPERASFRAYASPLESHRDFLRFLQENARYQAAWAWVQDPEQFLRAIHQAGYATDPRWADKVLALARQATAAARVLPYDPTRDPLAVRPIPSNEPGVGPPIVPLANTTGELARAVLAEAQSFIGTPYVWGGADRKGVDCSGLIVSVMQALGKPFPAGVRDAETIRRVSVPVPPNRAQPGDLVFFHSTYGNAGPGYATHVGILTEDGVMLDANDARGTVGYADFQRSPYWQAHFMEIRRPPQYFEP